MIRAEKLLPPADLLARQLTAEKISFVREMSPLPGRRFRADFMLAGKVWVECDGGTWARKGAKKCRYCGFTGLGRHSTGSGRERDCEKLNLAVLAGFRVLVVTTSQVRRGDALRWILQALRRTKNENT